MNLREFNNQVRKQLTIGTQQGFPLADVMIVTAMPSIGSRHLVEVKTLAMGFDWEMGKLLITPKTDLYTRTQEDEVKRLRRELDDMIWQNRNLKKAAGQ